MEYLLLSLVILIIIIDIRFLVFLLLIYGEHGGKCSSR